MDRGKRDEEGLFGGGENCLLTVGKRMEMGNRKFTLNVSRFPFQMAVEVSSEN